jgi:tungstate transport system substrate-binding protein
MLFSSHNLGQVKRLASRVIYLEHGQLVADLPVHDFFNGPLPEAARLCQRRTGMSQFKVYLALAHPSSAGSYAFVASGAVSAQSITMASTTSTEQSGLFSHLLPEFKKASGLDVKVVALGTGQALDTARRGDADVLFVHDQVAEESLWPTAGASSATRSCTTTSSGRPQGGPAGAQGKDIVVALKKLAAGNADFVSRGDKSGTHAAELRYWKLAGADAAKGSGYKECGCGMGPALNMAASSGAYVLADRGTWLNFKNRADLAILVEGDKRCSTSTA